MKTVIIYESVYGNTRQVAETLGAVAEAQGEVRLYSADDVPGDALDGADLVLVGGPTHVHGMSWSATRQVAPDPSGRSDGNIVGPDLPGPDLPGPGLRDWFRRTGRVAGTRAAAFDTRTEGPELLTGRASLGISRRLHHFGFTEVAAPRSFLVDRSNELLDGELARAREWGTSVVESLLVDVGR